ncbi:MAG: DUF4407 domain-containing protein [Longimicrobiaceae bacterium]
MKRFFLFCSGANTGVLASCPTDESKYVGIGVTILLTAVLASLSGGYALFTVFQSVPAAAAFGVLWGVVIFNLDRVIVSGMRKQKHFVLDLLFALPRFVISFFLAVVISRPLELRLFDVEIRDRWQQMQATARRADIARIRAEDEEQLADLRSRIDALKKEVNDRQAEADLRTQAWIDERAGVAGTGIPGPGSVYREKDLFRQQAERQLQEVKARNLPMIERNTRQIEGLLAEQQRRIAQADSVRARANGLLAKMEAFGALKHDSGTILWASLFITALFISLETAPVVVKLLSTLSPYRPYDEVLEEREIDVVETSRQQVKIRKHVLKTDAERTLADVDGTLATDLHLSTEKNQLRQEAELKANETLIERIAEAQVELAERLVEEWKRRELEKIENDLGAYVQP